MKNNLLKNYRFMLKTIYSASASRIWMTFLFTIVSDLFSIVYNVIFFAYFMNAVEKGESISQVSKALLSFIIFNIAFEILNACYNQIYLPKNDVRLSLFFKKLIYKKIASVDIECFDNPKYYDDVTLALNDLYGRVNNILKHLAQFVSHACCVVVLISYFAQIDLLIVAISFVSVLTGLFFEPMLNGYRYRFTNEGLKYQRAYEYVKRISIQPEYAQELRTTHVKNVLSRMLDHAYDGMMKLLKLYYKKITILDSIQVFLGFGIVSCITTLISIQRIVIDGTATLAMFLPLMGAIAQFTWRASSVIEGFTNILNDNIYLNKFLGFYQYKEKIVSHKEDRVEDYFHGIKVEHLYFRYDKNGDYVLNDICMDINPKQKIAVVGYNGAGKSTLINLLLRFYDPEQGSILYNGKNICDYNVKNYRSKYGVVFQDINVYATTVAENIAMDTNTYSDVEMKRIMKALHLDEKIDSYEMGFETQLTHELCDLGEILSIGQCQCLALARIFINPEYQLYILDEPTSALDPIAEEQLFTTINDYLEDKTVIYISHRFSASRMADKIYFMEQGYIAEQGTHDELLRKNGKYAEMFHLQAQYYRDNIEDCTE